MNTSHRGFKLIKLLPLLLSAIPQSTRSFQLSGATNKAGTEAVFPRSLRAFARPETLNRVTSILGTKFEKDEKSIDIDCNYRREFGADNLDEVEFLLTLEEEFDLTIPDHEFNELHTVKEISEYLDRKLARKTSH